MFATPYSYKKYILFLKIYAIITATKPESHTTYLTSIKYSADGFLFL